MKLFLCGDVMLGRGVDQVLPHSCAPDLYERYVRSALDYVDFAEQMNGPIPRSGEYSYVWGDALDVLADARPDARIINLETAITADGQPLPKGINYRMHPANTPVLTAAQIDCSVLANNHVLDWGEAGMVETLDALASVGIRVAGAGRNRAEAQQPAVLSVDTTQRVLVFGFGARDSGVPSSWNATEAQPGVAVLQDFSEETVEQIGKNVHATRRQGDVTVASVHWGGNWGYEIPAQHRQFAHELIDRASIDVVHGHSSHHPKAIEVYRDRLILYGCGDFLNDYEGIRGYEAFRDDLVVMYLPELDVRSGKLQRLELVPFQIRRFTLNRASATDRAWLCSTLDRECRRYGHRVMPVEDRLLLE